MLDKNVLLVAGHGGSDPGAAYGKFIEKTLNLDVTLKIGAILERHGVKVFYSRKTDKDFALNDIVPLAIKVNAFIVMSVHHNAGGGHGWDTLEEVDDIRSSVLMQYLGQEFTKVGMPRHAVIKKWNDAHTDNWHAALRDGKANRLIMGIGEYAFLDSSDNKKLDTDAELKVEAECYAKAILKYLGITYKAA